jgi:hypothetical protein
MMYPLRKLILNAALVMSKPHLRPFWRLLNGFERFDTNGAHAASNAHGGRQNIGDVVDGLPDFRGILDLGVLKGVQGKVALQAEIVVRGADVGAGCARVGRVVVLADVCCGHFGDEAVGDFEEVG